MIVLQIIAYYTITYYTPDDQVKSFQILFTEKLIANIRSYIQSLNPKTWAPSLRASQIISMKEMNPMPRTRPKSPPMLEKKSTQVIRSWLTISITDDVSKKICKS